MIHEPAEYVSKVVPLFIGSLADKIGGVDFKYIYSARGTWHLTTNQEFSKSIAPLDYTSDNNTIRCSEFTPKTDFTADKITDSIEQIESFILANSSISAAGYSQTVHFYPYPFYASDRVIRAFAYASLPQYVPPLEFKGLEEHTNGVIGGNSCTNPAFAAYVAKTPLGATKIPDGNLINGTPSVYFAGMKEDVSFVSTNEYLARDDAANDDTGETYDPPSNDHVVPSYSAFKSRMIYGAIDYACLVMVYGAVHAIYGQNTAIRAPTILTAYDLSKYQNWYITLIQYMKRESTTAASGMSPILLLDFILRRHGHGNSEQEIKNKEFSDLFKTIIAPAKKQLIGDQSPYLDQVINFMRRYTYLTERSQEKSRKMIIKYLTSLCEFDSPIGQFKPNYNFIGWKYATWMLAARILKDHGLFQAREGIDLAVSLEPVTATDSATREIVKTEMDTLYASNGSSDDLGKVVLAEVFPPMHGAWKDWTEMVWDLFFDTTQQGNRFSTSAHRIPPAEVPVTKPPPSRRARLIKDSGDDSEEDADDN